MINEEGIYYNDTYLMVSLNPPVDITQIINVDDPDDYHHEIRLEIYTKRLVYPETTDYDCTTDGSEVPPVRITRNEFRYGETPLCTTSAAPVVNVIDPGDAEHQPMYGVVVTLVADHLRVIFADGRYGQLRINKPVYRKMGGERSDL